MLFGRPLVYITKGLGLGLEMQSLGFRLEKSLDYITVFETMNCGVYGHGLHGLQQTWTNVYDVYKLQAWDCNVVHDSRSVAQYMMLASATFMARQHAQVSRARYCHITSVRPCNAGTVSKRLYTSNVVHGCVGPSHVSLAEGD